MDLMTPDRMDDYHEILDKKMTKALDAENGTFELFDLARRVLFETITKWAGINLDDLTAEEIDDLASYQISMISGTITSPTDHIEGVVNRNKSEKMGPRINKRSP